MNRRDFLTLGISSLVSSVAAPFIKLLPIPTAVLPVLFHNPRDIILTQEMFDDIVLTDNSWMNRQWNDGDGFLIPHDVADQLVKSFGMRKDGKLMTLYGYPVRHCEWSWVEDVDDGKEE